MNASASLYEQHTFQWGEHRLAYETCGEGPPVVLMHGVLLDSLVNRELGTRFAAEGCRVILFDLLGHGRSDKTGDPKDYRAEHFADQVIALLDHLGIGQAMIGGVSLGSVVTLQLAARAPERVSAMFLEMPVMEWSTPWAAVILAPILFTARYLSTAYRPMTRLMRRLPRPRKLSREWLGSLMNAGSLEPEVTAAILHGCLVGPTVPTEAARRAMQMPALVVGHGGDKLHSVEDARLLAEQLPNARLVEARHAIELRTRPDHLWPQIAEFVTEYAGSYETSTAAG
jgi:pimeloyl-ACP methyl ester carboxylesterase